MSCNKNTLCLLPQKLGEDDVVEGGGWCTRVDEDDVKLGVSSEVHGVEVVSGMTGELKE